MSGGILRVVGREPDCVDAVEVSTLVYLSPEEVYGFLEDFPRYAEYSDHLNEVRSDGDGGPGTEYELVFSWWKLTYTARSKVTGVDSPERIDWKLTKDIDAQGYWHVEHVPEEAPSGADDACRVRLHIDFRPDSVDEGVIDLPAFIGLDWVVKTVTPLVEAEAEQIVERIVADLEGEERPVELTIHQEPASV